MDPKRELPLPLTDGQMYDILILEATNQKTKSNILQRMHFILSLSGNKQKHEQMMGMNQAQVKASDDSIRTLTAMKAEWLKDQEAAVDNDVEKTKKKGKLK